MFHYTDTASAALPSKGYILLFMSLVLMLILHDTAIIADFSSSVAAALLASNASANADIPGCCYCY